MTRERPNLVPALVGFLILLALAMCVGGCGNVYLYGDALTAAQSSTMDAYGFWQRVDGNAQPFSKAYAAENVTQWRWFVRAAMKNATWGPKLPSDANQYGGAP